MLFPPALHDLFAPFKFVFQCAQGTHRMRILRSAYVAHRHVEMCFSLWRGAALEIKENKVELDQEDMNRQATGTRFPEDRFSRAGVPAISACGPLAYKIQR